MYNFSYRGFQLIFMEEIMGIVVRESKLLCCKGSGEFNEECCRYSRYGAWVLDGATGLNNKKIDI